MFQCINGLSYEGTVVFTCHPCILVFCMCVVRYYFIYLLLLFYLVILLCYYGTWLPVIAGKLIYGINFFLTFS